jgi:hypothetical protein
VCIELIHICFCFLVYRIIIKISNLVLGNTSSTVLISGFGSANKSVIVVVVAESYTSISVVCN